MTSDRLLDRLAVIGWSLRQLSVRLGCDETRVRRWAAGQQQIPPNVAAWLEKLAEAHEAAPMPAAEHDIGVETDMSRNRKFEAVFVLATALAAQGASKTFAELMQWLNAQGLQTNYGTPYVNERGVAKLVSSVYAYVRDELGLGDAGAEPVARAFTNQHGAYAYE